MISFSENRSRFGPVDVAIHLLGVVGLAASLTLVFLGMRAVMDIRGFCAEGGPYEIQTHCPDGVPLLMIGGIFGLFLFGGIMAWKGSVIGGPYAALVGLAWPALFLSLGWNFLEYGVRPQEVGGIQWGWLIPGIIFVIMGGVPLLAVLPFAHTGRVGDARVRLASSVAPRPRPSPNLDAERAAMATVMSDLLGQREAEGQPRLPVDFVSKLERLAALHQSGDLTDAEFDQSKRALISSGGGA